MVAAKNAMKPSEVTSQLRIPVDSNHPLVVFDGVCVLCNRAVDFIIRNDRRKVFRFAQIGSEAGTAIMIGFNSDNAPMTSVYLIEGGNICMKSTAVLRILRLLGGAWSMLYGFVLVPRFMRDGIYDFVARHRYGWFGRRTSCRVLTDDIVDRFVQ
jgi:predicted DCC family thiol-disulfide oxidoreductase YuxK